MICKHCGHEIVSVSMSDGRLFWGHPAPRGNSLLGRCRPPVTEYGYNAEPIGEPCQDPCLGTQRPDPNERTAA